MAWQRKSRAPSFLERWAKLYSNPTDAEAALEPEIAKLGVRYRFQHPIWAVSVFPDFVIPDYKLIIEVDDPSHRGSAKRREDADRTKRLGLHGWTVLRVENEEVEANAGAALRRILEPYCTIDATGRASFKALPNPKRKTR